MKVEVRAVGLKAMREKRGLTQGKLAHDLGISQNYVPAIEANTRQAGPKLQDALITSAAILRTYSRLCLLILKPIGSRCSVQ